MNDVCIRVNGGHIVATKTCDVDYPGIDIEFVSDRDNGSDLSRPRVLFEYPKDGRLRVLIWADKDNEDYTHDIEFDI